MSKPLNTEVDTHSLRYAIYARKSTEDSGSQIRSIDDQIKDCKEMAKREGLRIVKIIREERSAKTSHNRPQFTEMLNDIEAGKFDGIISWHPDRLSRNSLEAGMIVDMLDNEIIKDLKFPTCQFTNDSSGKMLLNILFAMSKQYSEHLREGVMRAQGNMLEEGKSAGIPKWGYNRDNETGLYCPDSNFDLIRKAWEMKLSGETNRDILKYLIQNGAKRMTKLSRKVKKVRPILPNKNSVGKMFSDPFYYGILVQADQEVDLRKITNFQPMVSEEEYEAVQAIIANTPKGRRGIKKGKRMVFYPLRGLVTCGVCGAPMYAGASRSSNKKDRYLYYRCSNKECSRESASVRAHFIFDALYEAVDRLHFTEKRVRTL